MKTDKPLGKWREAYNCHHLSIAGGVLDINVNWNSLRSQGEAAGFRVSVGNRTLAALYKDLYEGKAAGIALAQQMLREATADLDAILYAEEHK